VASRSAVELVRRRDLQTVAFASVDDWPVEADGAAVAAAGIAELL
jgi:hypothetical protein